MTNTTYRCCEATPFNLGPRRAPTLNEPARGLPGLHDPTALPNELQMAIFSLLDQQCLLQALKVSRRWHRAVICLSDYLAKPHFAANLTGTKLQGYLDSCHRTQISRVKSLTVRGKDVEDQKGLVEALYDSNVHVDHLDLQLANDILLCEPVLDTSSELMGFKLLGSSFLGGLKSLELGIFSLEMRDVLCGTLNLLKSVEFLSILVKGSFADRQAYDTTCRCTLAQLKTFKLEFTGLFREQADVALMSEFFSHIDCPVLESLSVRAFPVHASAIATLCGASTKHLEVQWVLGLQLDGFVDALQHTKARLSELVFTSDIGTKNTISLDKYDLSFLSELSSLTLVESRLSSEGLFRILSSTGENMRSLEIVFSKINYRRGFSFTRFLDYCPHLEELAFSHCQKFNESSCRRLCKAIRRKRLLRLGKLSVRLASKEFSSWADNEPLLMAEEM